MAEIRCPMCGKPNPDELDICQFCEARLKPLRIQPPQNGYDDKLPEWSKPDQNGEHDTEDKLSIEDVEDSQEWLDRIRSDAEIKDEPIQEIEPKSPPDDDSAADTDEDWLQRVRSLQDDDQADETELDSSLFEPHSDASPDDDTLIADEDDSTEWLERLQDLKGPDDDTPSVEETEAITPEASEPTIEDELPDWLPAPPSEEPESEAAIPEQEEVTPDWLSGLSVEDEAAIPEEAEPALEDELPDWLPAPSSEEPESEAAIPEQEEGTPDWLSGLGVEGEAATPEEAEPALGGELPDWLPAPHSEEPESEAAIPEQVEDTPDWLSELGIEDEVAAPEEVEPALEDELPDWLPAQPSEEPESEAAIPEQKEVTPDWLSGLSVEDEATIPEEAEPALEDELPDWLPAPSSEEPESEAAIPEQEEGTPDWLSGLGVEGEADVPEEAEPALEGELPDWIPEPPSKEEPLAEAAIPEQEEDTPDWLSRLGVEGEAAIPEEAEPTLEGELPDWIPEPPSEEEAEAAIPEQVDGTPDWLSELGVDDEAATPEEVEPAFKGELPDWLPAPSSEEPEVEAAIPDQEEDTPDWLSGLGVDDETVAPEEAEPAIEGELPDWLPAPSSEEPETRAIIPEQEKDTPNWLSGLGVEDEAAIPEEAEPAIEGELPDWLPAISSEEPESEAVIPEQEEETPDWLSELGIEGETDVPEEAEPALEGELPDWILEPPSEEEPLAEAAIPEQEEDTPDWPSELGIEGEIDAPEEAETTLEGELPDWIPEPPSEEEPEVEAAIPEQEESKPDWLSELGVEDEAASPEDFDPAIEEDIPVRMTETPQEELEAEPAISEQEKDTPDWLLELGIEYEAATSEDAEPAIEEDIPDWLTEAPEEEPKAEPVIPGQEQDIPDWLSDQDESSRFPAPEVGSKPEGVSEPGDIGIFDAQVPKRPSEQVPDWLSDEDEGVEPATTEDEDLQSWFSELDKEPELSGEPESLVSDTGEDMPGWLKNLGSVVTGTIEDDDVPQEKDGGISPFVDQESFDDDLLDVESLPEWLSPETAVPDDREEIEDDSSLSPAELPGWLAAMRPVDVKKPKEPLDEGLIESAGPLAGLQSVLPVEAEITRFTKPPVYSAKLKVTRSQQEHANLFHKMLSVEGELEPLPPTPLISSQRALRWVIALILMISIGFFVIGGGEFIPLPGNTAIPDATYASSQIISSIPDKAPVLLAFDYQPGIAGEMNAAAAGLVDHLMLKGARLSLVSTQPTGPALAEYFIQTIQSQHGYTKGVQYVNLGYIPGGATGLLSFAQTPEWVFPLSYNGFSPWETQPLRGVDSLSDFALIVVITEDPEDARAWIEQVQPRIGDTPMLTVLSAQAEPLVRPYYGSDQSAQVKGIVSGLSGGAAYEVTVGRANFGRTYWDAFSVGLLIALGAVLIGGLVNVVQLLIPRKNNDARGNSS